MRHIFQLGVHMLSKQVLFNFTYYLIHWWCNSYRRTTTIYIFVLLLKRARDTVVGWGIMLQAGRSRVLFPMRSLDFSIDLNYGPRVDLNSNRNEYQESFWGGTGSRRLRLTTWPPSESRLSIKMWEPRRLTNLWASTACYRDSMARKADHRTAICELIVQKMWEPRRLTTLWTSTAGYRDSFTLFACF
jgi:hypothetical protein